MTDWAYKSRISWWETVHWCNKALCFGKNRLLSLLALYQLSVPGNVDEYNIFCGILIMLVLKRCMTWALVQCLPFGCVTKLYDVFNRSITSFDIWLWNRLIFETHQIGHRTGEIFLVLRLKPDWYDHEVWKAIKSNSGGFWELDTFPVGSHGLINLSSLWLW